MRAWCDRLFRLGGLLSAAVGCVIFLSIIGVIVFRGVPALSLSFFVSESALFGFGGVRNQIVGTLVMVVLAGCLALPISIGTALFYVHFLPRKWRRLVTVILYSLNGVPTIVYGLFGFIVFSLFFGWGTSLLTGVFILAIMILPTMIVSCIESMDSVADEFKIEGLSLGFSAWDTLRHIVLPRSVFGIVTGFLLGLMRAAGETAAILFTATGFLWRRIGVVFI